MSFLNPLYNCYACVFFCQTDINETQFQSDILDQANTTSVYPWHDPTHTDWFNGVEVNVVDRASVPRQFVEDASTGGVPHVHVSVSWPRRHLAAVWTPRNTQHVLQTHTDTYKSRVRYVLIQRRLLEVFTVYSRTDLFNRTPSRLLWEASSHVTINAQRYSYINITLSIARYSFIQLRKLEQCTVLHRSRGFKSGLSFSHSDIVLLF